MKTQMISSKVQGTRFRMRSASLPTSTPRTCYLGPQQIVPRSSRRAEEMEKA
jgi:hypothetical protein